MNGDSVDNLKHGKYKMPDFTFEGPLSLLRCSINLYFFPFSCFEKLYYIFLKGLWHLYRSATEITDKFDILGALS